MKIYIVMKNVDFTEGRGPMLFDKAFVTFKRLEEYLNPKSGVFGWRPPSGRTMTEAAMKKFNTGGWAGYEIKEVEAE